MIQEHVDESFDILFKNCLLVGKNDINMFYLARIFFLHKDYVSTRKYLSLSIKYCNLLKKNIPIELLILYSRTYREEGQIDKAIEYLLNNLLIGRDSGSYLAHLGAFYVMINQYEKGIFYLQQAKLKKIYPDWTNIWLDKAKNLF